VLYVCASSWPHQQFPHSKLNFLEFRNLQVTPVIRNAESLTVGQLDQTIAALANKASTNQVIL
jgi:hypothetical protein